MEATNVVTHVSEIIDQLTLQLNATEQFIQEQQIEEVRDSLQTLEDALSSLHSEQAMKTLQAALFPANHSSSSTDPVDQKLQELNKLMQSEMKGTLSMKEDQVKLQIQAVKQRLGQLQELVKDSDQRTAGIEFAFSKIDELSSTVNSLTEQIHTLLTPIHAHHQSSRVPDNTPVTQESTKPSGASTNAKPKSTTSSRKSTRGRPTAKDIDRQLPAIMDDIYSQLIFKTPQQRIQYYKERDDTIKKYKDKLKQTTMKMSSSTAQLDSSITKNSKVLSFQLW